MSDTNIAVSIKVWSYLNGQKTPSQSFDDVLRDELDLESNDEAAHAAHD